MSPFATRVYELLCQVPKGRVTTYKALAQAMNCKAYQAIGQVLKNNPNAPIIPCHRVVSTNGKIGGFMGKTTGVAIKKKLNLLKKEGVLIKNGQVEHFSAIIFNQFK